MGAIPTQPPFAEVAPLSVDQGHSLRAFVADHDDDRHADSREYLWWRELFGIKETKAERLARIEAQDAEYWARHRETRKYYEHSGIRRGEPRDAEGWGPLEDSDAASCRGMP